jgi:UDP-N-acetylmuramoyl-L-alanyl-D-glutamate--2,6-diaminopimelate ligase
VIGTIETRIHGDRQPGVRTTPEGPDLQRLLRRMRTRGVDAVAMEVSSHGLDLRRVDGTHFEVAAYTNLSQDHLDWHGSMAAYLAAKARLFTRTFADRGVVHLDGPWARRLLEQVEIPVRTLGRPADADVRIVSTRCWPSTGSQARLVGGDLDVVVRTVLPGRFNLTNAATALVAAVEAGVDPRGCRGRDRRLPGRPRSPRTRRRGAAVHGARRLRPLPRRGEPGARHPAASRSGPAGCTSCSAAAATATARSAARWAPRRAAPTTPC